MSHLATKRTLCDVSDYRGTPNGRVKTSLFKDSVCQELKHVSFNNDYVKDKVGV